MKLVNNGQGCLANCYANIEEDQFDRSKRIILLAKRKIKQGEELFFDYGFTEEKQHQISWVKYFN